MSQEYREDKTVLLKVTLKKINIENFLVGFIFLMISFFIIFLIVSLMAFHPSDPTWMQTSWDESVQNLGGRIGACLADILFSLFGVLAYVVPLVILSLHWDIFRDVFNHNYPDFFTLSLRLIGGLGLIVSLCSLSSLSIDDLLNFSSGGIVGSVFSNLIVTRFDSLGTILVLFFIWGISFTLFTGLSWITIAEKIGEIFLSRLVLISNYFRINNVNIGYVCTDNKKQGRETYISSYPFRLYEDRSEIVNNIDFVDMFFFILRCEKKTCNNLLSNILFLEDEDVDSNKGVGFIRNQISDDTKFSNSTDFFTFLIQKIYLEHGISFRMLKSQIKKSINFKFFSLDFISFLMRGEVFANSFMIQEKKGLQEMNLNFIGHFKSRIFDVGIHWNQYRLCKLFLEKKKIVFYFDQINNCYNRLDNLIINDQKKILDKKAPKKLVDSKSHIECKCVTEKKEVTLKEKKLIKDITKTSSKSSKEKKEELLYQETFFDLFSNEEEIKEPVTRMPSLDLLTQPLNPNQSIDSFTLEKTSRLIEAGLSDYRVKAEVVSFSLGPVITRFELDLAPGIKAARISNLSRDLARSLLASAVRIVEVIPGKPYVGLELPNKQRQIVYLRELLDCDKFRHNSSPLTIALGKDIEGNPVIVDLEKMPHLLVSGTTGSGKSVWVNVMILSILYKAKPEDVRFIMIDPKMLELSIYEGIPHLLSEVVTDMNDAFNVLGWCVNEMERRYKLMLGLGVKNLTSYNKKINIAERMGFPISTPFWKCDGRVLNTNSSQVLKKEPYIVVIVDEFSDLMMTSGKRVEELIARLAQKARAAGIHLVLATQRPSVDVITGLIKANIPSRIAFTVSSKIDSRTILDQGGAESLLGMGDMLYLPSNSSIPIRVHGAFVCDQEVYDVAKYWQGIGKPQYVDSITKSSKDEDDERNYACSDERLDRLFCQVVKFVTEKQRVSVSGVQRQFHIGYNRAARIVEQMESRGVISKPTHNGNREVLLSPGEGYC